MFTKSKKIFAIVFIVISMLLLSLYLYNDSIDSLAISDPEIKKEIEFMRSKNIITELMYQRWLVSKRSDILDERDILIDEQGTVRHDGAYRMAFPSSYNHIQKDDLIPTDEQLLDRRIVQDLIQESLLSSNILSGTDLAISNRNKIFTGERLPVKRPGFKFVNTSYEQFRDEMFQQEKAGTPWREQEYNVKQLYEERLQYEQYLIKQGYN